MLRSPKLNVLIPALSLMVLVSLSAAADDCPVLISADCDGGFAWFGLRYDGAVVAQGQTISLVCDGQVNAVEFKFRVSGIPNGDVPSMVAGDEIHVALMDVDGNVLNSATTAVPADVFNDWIIFDFPEGVMVPAGEYQLSAYTTVPRQCSMHFAYGGENDCYDGGQRMASLNGLEGPWFDFGGDDVPFRAYVTSGPLANDALSWGSIKGLYR